MAIDASRILRVHESCLSLLKAKKNPYINTRDLNVFF